MANRLEKVLGKDFSPEDFLLEVTADNYDDKEISDFYKRLSSDVKKQVNKSMKEWEFSNKLLSSDELALQFGTEKIKKALKLKKIYFSERLKACFSELI